jgi:hypothetical protein
MLRQRAHLMFPNLKRKAEDAGINDDTSSESSATLSTLTNSSEEDEHGITTRERKQLKAQDRKTLRDQEYDANREIISDDEEEEEIENEPLEEDEVASIKSPETPAKQSQNAGQDEVVESPKQEKKQKKQVPVWPRREFSKKDFGTKTKYNKLLGEYAAFWDSPPKSVQIAKARVKKNGVSSAVSHSPSRHFRAKADLYQLFQPIVPLGDQIMYVRTHPHNFFPLNALLRPAAASELSLYLSSCAF